MTMKLTAASGRQVEVRPTLVDRVVNYFNPESGSKRLKARAHSALVGGYDGGRRDRRMLRNKRFKETDTDTLVLPDLPDLRSRSDELVRNTPIATGAEATTVTHVVGTGLQLQASLDPKALGITDVQADEMEREQEREWALFCASCDFTRVQVFDEMQPTAFRSVLRDGDTFMVRRYRKDPGDVYGTKLQMVRAARVSNPNQAADSNMIVSGVELNADGVPIGYHVANRHPGQLLRNPKELKWERVPARTGAGKQMVVHLFDRVMFDQTRGIPYLAPVIEHLMTLGKYTEAEVAAAVVSAMFTVFIKGAPDDDENPSVGERGAGDDLEDNETKLGVGAIHNLADGEEAQFADPSRPNTNFDPFVQAILRQVGVALELPFELLVKHFTASYSASRAALEMGWQFFKKQRTWLARRYCQTAYEWMMEEAVASGRLNRPGFFEDVALRRAYLGTNWIGPPRISLDPEKEARADVIDVQELNVKTREQVVLERIGGRIENHIVQLGKEQAAIDAAGIRPKVQAGAAAPAPPPDNGGNDTQTGDNETQPQRSTA